MNNKLELELVKLLRDGRPIAPEAMREAAEMICELRRRLMEAESKLSRIQEQATRRHRATTLKKYLLRDLEIIETICEQYFLLASPALASEPEKEGE